MADVFPSFKFLDSISRVRSKLMNIHDRLDVLFDAIINERRSKKATVKKTDESEEEHELADFLDVLMNLQKNEDQEFNLTDDNIKAIIVVSLFIFLFFGYWIQIKFILILSR